MDAIVYHWTPDLLNKLIDTIPRLNRSKPDVLAFFRSAGVGVNLTKDLSNRVKKDPKNISKYEITRTVLTRLLERGDASIRERREVIKRVVEFENFSSCWENDRLEAKGLVADIREMVGVKDSFTRMKQERDEEVKRRRAEREKQLQADLQRKREREAVTKELLDLFKEQNPHKRGKALEGVLNRLFEVAGISVRKSFELLGDEGEGVVEQIDGVVEINGRVYLVEMKWWENPIGVPEIAPHLIRLFERSEAGAIFISSSRYTDPAISACKQWLSKKVIVLCTLNEIVFVLERGIDLKVFFNDKINATIADHNPFCWVLESPSY